jgi:hypothetical protein
MDQLKFQGEVIWLLKEWWGLTFEDGKKKRKMDSLILGGFIHCSICLSHKIRIVCSLGFKLLCDFPGAGSSFLDYDHTVLIHSLALHYSFLWSCPTRSLATQGHELGIWFCLLLLFLGPGILLSIWKALTFVKVIENGGEKNRTSIHFTKIQ